MDNSASAIADLKGLKLYVMVICVDGVYLRLMPHGENTDENILYI